MHPEDKNIKESKSSTFYRMEKMHPFKMFLTLSMIGSGLIFLFLLISFLYTKPEDFNFSTFNLPRAFVLSSIVLVSSSFIINRVLHYFATDNGGALRLALGMTLLSGIIFIVLQYVGWLELAAQGLVLSGKPYSGFIYLISGLHGLHCIGGIIYLTVVFVSVLKALNDPVKTLIMFTNPFQKLKLQLLVMYWHYLDGLWLFIFMFLLFSLS